MSHDSINLPKGFHDLGEEIKARTEIAALEKEADSKVHYPSLWFHNKAELKDLPKEGTAVIHYKKIMEREETITINGKKEQRYTTELQIHGIKSTGAGESAPEEAEESEEYEKNEPDDEDAIEKGLEAASKDTSTED
jgi:hypothetical protein